MEDKFIILEIKKRERVKIMSMGKEDAYYIHRAGIIGKTMIKLDDWSYKFEDEKDYEEFLTKVGYSGNYNYFTFHSIKTEKI